MTLEEFLVGEWLPAISATIRPTTLTGYRDHVRCHIVPALGPLPIEEIEPNALNRFYARLSVVDGRKRRVSSTTIRRVHATLRRALRDAVRWGYLETNPCERADPPRQARVEMSVWDADQLKAFLASVETDPLYPLWTLLAMTGMRRGEALGLRRRDLDLVNARLSVRQSLVSTGREIYLSELKTARGRRVVALDAHTVEILRAQVADAWLYDLVFVDGAGEPLNPNWVTRRFQNLVARAGLGHFRLHDLRHTHATLALEAGVHPKIVSERLGHSTVAFTLDVYSHALPSMQEQAAGQVAALVFGALPPARPGSK